MSVKSLHPEYSKNIENVVLVRDCHEGEFRIKEKGISYLPATTSQILDGMQAGGVGYLNYLSYKMRAVFPEYVKDAVDRYEGILHKKNLKVQLPAKMELLIKKATKGNETIYDLFRRITEEQLISGRLGLMFDISTDTKEPYLTLYPFESIINWGHNDGLLDFLVLDECTYERSGFDWVQKEEYRVCELDEFGDYITREIESDFEEPLEESNEFLSPMYFGQTLKQIPFTFINTKDITADIDQPPLISLARMSVSIYRSEADYRHALYMQGQDTLVIINGRYEQGATRVGAGAKIDVEIGGDAKYIGVSSSGLAEMRQALDSDKNYARYKSGHLIQTGKSDAESGKALMIRTGAQVATLTDIARTAATGLEKVLKIGAEWMGLNPDDVVITPNLDFTGVEIDGQNLVQLQTAKTMGAPLSNESIHNIIRERGLTSLSYEEELEKISDESPVGSLITLGDNNG